jgi:hypothetical protein
MCSYDAKNDKKKNTRTAGLNSSFNASELVSGKFCVVE